MNGFTECLNCGEYTGGNKYCGKACKCEYHVMNLRMSERALNVLKLLSERRGWVHMANSQTVASMSISRLAPLIATRNENRVSCEAHILPNGERWLKYHTESEAAA